MTRHRRPSRSVRLLVAVVCATAVLITSTPGTSGRAEAAVTGRTTNQIGRLPTTNASAVASTKRPDPNQPVLILMDVSSSMDESGGSGATRLDGAKQAVNEFITELPEKTAVGLDVYPGDGDCSEGTAAIPLAPSNTEDMARYVRSLHAEGNTPTGLALQKAARDLKAYVGSKGGVIVLVSDGESNCESTSPPPCDVANELAAQGFDLTVNTVGFQISDAGRTELQCIAEATAGTYVDVKDPKDLPKALAPNGIPEVTLKVSYPERVVLVPGTNDTVHITATVTNTGKVLAPNVQATITYDAKFSPGSANPRRRLGNLAPGEAETFDWTFRPVDQFAGETVAFSAVAITDSRPTEPITGSILFEPPDSKTVNPTWLAGATDFIILGDSYSSGEGLASSVAEGSKIYEPGTDTPFNFCHRGKAGTYAHELAKLVSSRVKVHNLACSGAITWDYWDNAKTTKPQHGSNDAERDRLMQRAGGTENGDPLPAQRAELEALLTQPGAKNKKFVIFMTMGGNDMGFEPVAKRCLTTSFAQHLMYPSPQFETALAGVSGTPQAIALLLTGKLLKAARSYGIYDYGTCGTHQGPEFPSGDALVGRNLNRLGDEAFPAIYRDIDRIAQDKLQASVPILVPLYPRPFPADATSFCHPSVQATFTPDDRRFLNTTTDRLNNTIQRAITTTRTSSGTPVWAVDTTQAAFQSGHTYCDSDPWINRLDLGGLLSLAGDSLVNFTVDHPVLSFAAVGPTATQAGQDLASSTARHDYRNMFHPNAEGYKAEARNIQQWAANHRDVLPANNGTPGAAPLLTGPPPPVNVTKVSKTGSATLNPGRSTMVQAAGFDPKSVVTVDIESNPEPLTIAVADDKGSISAPASIRADFPLGKHHLVVRGYDRNGKPVTYRMPVTVERPTPRWWLPAIGGSGTAVIIAAICAVAFTRSRRRTREATREATVS